MTPIENAIGTGRKVLIVDDDRIFCTLIAQTLKSNGYEALQAFTGEDGLNVYEREKPDLILLDVAMPGISGFEVATTIRNREQDVDHHTPIVIMTAHASSYTVSVSFHMGISSYLTKPVLPHDVLAQVRNLLPLEAKEL
jgi:DNA-binding response OmpR family regulator